MTPDQLLPQVYDELRKLAAAKMRNEADGHTLDATALVNEGWLKLNANSFSSKTDFIRAAAVAMRRETSVSLPIARSRADAAME